MQGEGIGDVLSSAANTVGNVITYPVRKAKEAVEKLRNLQKKNLQLNDILVKDMQERD